MQAWHFSENAYHLLPEANDYSSIRVTLPNRYYDPELGADLYHRFIDEWVIADELGLEVMVNEHHQTATNLNPAAPIIMGILARETKRARLLILGNPIANRREPVRVAEEMAMVDVYSRGRLEVGFVRGVPYEISAGNHPPTPDARALLGGSRPDPQSLDQPRRAVQLGGQVFPPPSGQHLAASLPTAPSAGLDHLHQPGDGQKGE